jgi:hypothetical protein
MPKLILSVYSDSDYSDSCDKAHVDLTPEVACRLLARMDEVKERHGPAVSGPYKMIWDDYLPQFLPYTDEEREAECGPLECCRETAGILLAPETFTRAEDKLLATYGPSLHGDAMDVWWKVTPRHGDIYLNTEYLSHACMEAWLKAPSVPPSQDPFLQEFGDTWEQAFVNNENIRGADLVEWGAEWLRRSRGKQ